MTVVNAIPGSRWTVTTTVGVGEPIVTVHPSGSVRVMTPAEFAESEWKRAAHESSPRVYVRDESGRGLADAEVTPWWDHHHPDYPNGVWHLRVSRADSTIAETMIRCEGNRA